MRMFQPGGRWERQRELSQTTEKRARNGSVPFFAYISKSGGFQSPHAPLDRSNPLNGQSQAARQKPPLTPLEERYQGAWGQRNLLLRSLSPGHL